MSQSLQGKTALVTGAGSGIGAASARLFAREGARVVVADINAESAEKTAAEINAVGGKAIALECDVTDESAVESAVKLAVAEFGSLDCAHNNAGISLPPVAFADITKEDFEKVISINLTSVFVCMKHEIAQMLKQKEGGAIVNTASGAALVPAPGQPHYTAAKRGIVGLTTHASDEYKHTKIRVNCILPGIVDTPMLGEWARSGKKALKAVLAHIPQNRLADPEEIAEGVVWLCSPAASWVSGDSMVIDGGLVNR